MSNLASRKRVFKPRVLYGTRVSKTRDASLQLSFKRVLTYIFYPLTMLVPKYLHIYSLMASLDRDEKKKKKELYLRHK